jgi:hypothetical protein
MLKSISIIFLLSTLILLLSCNGKPGSGMKGDAGIAFMDSIIEFGELEFSGNGDCEFVFTNTGSTPLLVTHVRTTCGCTIPEWSEEPVNSGETGTIRVSYDTHRIGPFRKSIYVYSNATNGTKRLFISGEVLRPEIAQRQQ